MNRHQHLDDPCHAPDARALSRPYAVLVQNPPAAPTLLVAWIAARARRAVGPLFAAGGAEERRP